MLNRLVRVSPEGILGVNQNIPFSCFFNANSDFVKNERVMIGKMLFKRCWIAEAITAAGTIGSAAINATSQARTNAQNRAQAEYAFQQQRQAIAEQNVYNSPAQQVLRMKAAGLNPSLAYGADGAMVGNQSDIPAYTPIPAEAPNVGQIGSGLAEAVRTGIEVRDLQRRQDLAVAEIAAQDWQNFVAMTQGELNQAQTKETLDLLGYRAENLESLTKLNLGNLDKMRAEIREIDQNIEVMRKQLDLTDAQIDELAARAGLERNEAIAIIAKLPHEIAAMDAESAFAYAQTDQCREQILNLAAERYQMAFVRDLENRKFNFSVNSKVADLEFERWQTKVGVMNHVQDNVSRILTLGIGYSALKNGQVLPPRANPVGSHYGGSRVGSIRPGTAPKTNAAGQPLGRR